MAIAVLVIVVGLIVGVLIELAISNRQHSRRGVKSIDSDTIAPGSPQLPQPRFIDDGEGFRIVGPVEYDDQRPKPWDEDPRGESSADTPN